MHPLAATALAKTRDLDTEAILERLGTPLVILSAPRSGSTLLFEQLRGCSNAASIGGESHGVFNVVPGLAVGSGVDGSGRLDERHATPRTVDLLRRMFVMLLRDSKGRPRALDAEGLNLVEKTPRNVLNLPFISKLFPGCRFLVLYRRPEATIASLVEAWQAGLETGRFVTARGLPGWDRAAWCFALPRGWQAMAGHTLVEIAAFQWAACYRQLLDDLAAIPRERIQGVRYEALVADPGAVIGKAARFGELGAPERQPKREGLPLSATTLSPPAPDKWRRLEDELALVQDTYAPVAAQVEGLFGEAGVSLPSDRA